MKKFLFILMMGALALPLMAQGTYAAKKVQRSMDRDQVVQTTPVKSLDATNRTFINNRGEMLVWDFESDESFEGWGTYDADGDGYGWEVDEYYSYNGGSNSLTSRSYYGGEGLTPDNWLISPDVVLEGVLSIYAMNYSSNWPDKFAVYVCVGEYNIDNFVKISDDITPPDTWTEYTFDMSEYAGQVGCFAIRHYDCYDKFRLFVDYISLGVPVIPLPTPENVTVTPGATTAEVEWDGAEDVAWNLRYRVPNGDLFWDFEDEAQMADWTLVDADGDGFNWRYFNNTGLTSGKMTPYEGQGLMISASYDNDSGVALTPDNWMISPKVKLDGVLSFWAAGQDPSYAAEVFGIFVSTDMENWTQIGEDITVSGYYTNYAFDLNEFRGEEGYFAIRHYNVTDQFFLNIDNVGVYYGEPAEWVVVEGITDPNYVIQGLDPETNYEVQVQAYNDEQESAWTASTYFTTLAEQTPPEPPVDQVGAPTFEGYTEDGIYGYGVYIHPTTEGSSIKYRVFIEEDGQWVLVTDWTDYLGVPMEIWMNQVDAKYRIEAYAYIGDVTSNTVAYEYQVEPWTSISEMNAGKTVAGVRYFNMAGQEMQQANGLTIMVTTYTDGTTVATKVVK